MYRGIIYVQSTEMEFSEFIYKNFKIGNEKIITYLNTNKWISILKFITYKCKRCQICTHTIHTNINCDWFGDVNPVGRVERGEGRRDWEGMEQEWIIWLHLNLLFFVTYIIPLYIYLDMYMYRRFRRFPWIYEQ